MAAPEDGAVATETPAETEEGEEPKPKPLPRRQRVRSCDPTVGIDLAMEPKGLASEEPTTIGRVFRETVAKVPDHPALRYKEEGEWKTITYSQYYSNCVRVAKSFLKVGREVWGGGVTQPRSGWRG